MSDKEPNFSRYYRIPKRSSNTAFGYETPLDNVLNEYKDYTVERRWQQGATFTQYPTHSPPVKYPTLVSNSVEPITQNIWNTLNNIKETPKNQQRNMLKETIPDVDDTSLPKELTSMFQPLFCKLCSAQLSSNVMAKIHYKSKNHEKNIRKFLIEHSQKTGEPLHKRAKVCSMPKSEDDNNPKWFHCDVCDLPLTGRIHAESHYMGKNHRKALTGHKPPAGLGYYDATGKWVRTAPMSKKTLKDGEDTFGEDFKRKSNANTTASSDPAITTPPTTPTSLSVSTSAPSKYYCELCKVGATCLEQLDMHFNGQKHKKKLKNRGLPMVNINENAGKTDDSGANSTVTDPDLTSFRTPSGEYYCSLCNLTLNSDKTFRTHLSGKSHRKKLQKQDSQ